MQKHVSYLRKKNETTKKQHIQLFLYCIHFNAPEWKEKE